MRTTELTALAHVLGVPWTAQCCVRFSPRRDRPVCTDMGSFVCYAFGQATRVRGDDVPDEVTEALQDAAVRAFLDDCAAAMLRELGAG